MYDKLYYFYKRLWEVFSQPVPPKRESDVVRQQFATEKTTKIKIIQRIFVS